MRPASRLRKAALQPRSRVADRPLAVASRQHETERVVVIEWRFPPGEHTGWRRREHDDVVVPITTGELLIDTNGDPFRSRLVAGQSSARERGAKHGAINDHHFSFVFSEIEIKP